MMKQEDASAQYIVPNLQKKVQDQNHPISNQMDHSLPNYPYFPHPHHYPFSVPWQFPPIFQSYIPSTSNIQIKEEPQQIAEPISNSSSNKGKGKEMNTKKQKSNLQSQDEEGLNATRRITRSKNKCVPPKMKKQKKEQYDKRNKNGPSYNWNQVENRRYVSFLKSFPNFLDLTIQQKKKLRVNVMMSKRVKTRTSGQCHTHHQKMVAKFKTYEGIINGVKFREIKNNRRKKLSENDQVKVEENLVDQ